jgi:hypothetical protein
MPIHLDSLDQLPVHISAMLMSLRTDFLNIRCIDDLVRDSRHIDTIQRAITDFLEETGVVAYHYTRAHKKSIQDNGLFVQEGSQRRQWFLDTYGHLFTPDEISVIRTTWDRYFTKYQDSLRNGKICFNHTKDALTNGGAGPLLENFGGEMIYMPLGEHSSISSKIKQIGEPLIVHCRLKPSLINGSWDYPSAVVWLSTYHRTINPVACSYDVDINTQVSVPPEDIIKIESVTTWA